VFRIHVGLPERNTLAGAVLYSRRTVKSPWIRRLSTQLYRLQIADGEVNNADLSVAGVSDRYWRLSVEQSGGGLGAGGPGIRIAWQPHDLVFIARGEPPFTLAWGSARVAPPLAEAANPFDRVGASAMLNARLDEEISHPGDGAAVARPIDWRRYTLWGCAGVRGVRSSWRWRCACFEA